MGRRIRDDRVHAVWEIVRQPPKGLPLEIAEPVKRTSGQSTGAAPAGDPEAGG